jgi:hypothetical protein
MEPSVDQRIVLIENVDGTAKKSPSVINGLQRGYLIV